MRSEWDWRHEDQQFRTHLRQDVPGSGHRIWIGETSDDLMFLRVDEGDVELFTITAPSIIFERIVSMLNQALDEI